MIAQADNAPFWLRLAAPFAWRTEKKIARKLLGFAATEQGSALDMLRAADLVDDPRLRRLFFRHGLDEARHAQRFRAAAAALASARVRGREARHAVREDLFETLGLERFVAFVYLSERRAKQQFDVLARHFADRPALARLFASIGRDEKGHVAYSKALLDEWTTAGRGKQVRKALRRVRMWQAWTGWRRAGHQLVEPVVRLVLAGVWLTVLPPFALIAKLTRRRRSGWRLPERPQRTLEDLRRAF